MRRWLLLFLLPLGFVYGLTRSQEIIATESSAKTKAAWSVAVKYSQRCYTKSQREQTASLCLIATRGLNRITGGRPLRVLPGNHAGHRIPSRIPFAGHLISPTQKHLFAGRRLETAPFRRAVSRAYYVIALRRLII